LGQSFLADPNLARAIVADAGIRSGDRVLEVGPGLGSLTVVLAGTEADVLAVERDAGLEPALREVLAPFPNVRLEMGDALLIDWEEELSPGDWKMVSNLPYGIAVQLLIGMLEGAPRIREYMIMVQREVGERLAAEPGDDAYGAVTLRVAYRADATLVRRVPAEVFWPRPRVESVLVRLSPRPAQVDVAPEPLFRVIEEGFAERRKTMGNALRRLGVDRASAGAVMEQAGLDADVRAERLGLPEFASLTRILLRDGVIR
jgi:16S rRNA (adenine1518-N6/adenine1519-N6)-dimethyltransferase